MPGSIANRKDPPAMCPIDRLKQALKSRLKANDCTYWASLALRNALLSVPYALQSLKARGARGKLMLGTNTKQPGWITMDIAPGADYLGDISSLRLFPDGSFDTVYASHVLEHLSAGDGRRCLGEIRRVLAPGGQVLLSVPDLVAVSRLLDQPEHELAVQIIYGINANAPWSRAEHRYGYSERSLAETLSALGYRDIERFEPFIDDTSKLYVGNTPVSICIKATRP
jgi:SAM-dependent methyltransferase